MKRRNTIMTLRDNGLNQGQVKVTCRQSVPQGIGRRRVPQLNLIGRVTLGNVRRILVNDNLIFRSRGVNKIGTGTVRRRFPLRPRVNRASPRKHGPAHMLIGTRRGNRFTENVLNRDANVTVTLRSRLRLTRTRNNRNQADDLRGATALRI